MANQVLTPPELQPMDEVPGTLNPTPTSSRTYPPIGGSSLLGGPRLVNDVVDEPVWKTIYANIRDLFVKEKLPPLELTSKPIAVADPFAVKRDPVSSGVSVGVHLLIIALIAWFIYLAHLHIKPIQTAQVVTPVDVPAFMPIAPKGPAMGGGGGGGSHDIMQTPKGKLPKFEKVPITPPMVIKNINPKLAVDPAINVPKNIAIPNNNMPNLGLPSSTVVGPQSNGTGSLAGMGSGTGGGIGQGSGNGLGSGTGGGYGGGVYHVGGGVSAPRLIYSVDPEFSDEARRAKYQGVAAIECIVDAQGNVQRPRTVRPLGMGLDEKAIEAVKQYKFAPAMKDGKPVPVVIDVEVNFRIY